MRKIIYLLALALVMANCGDKEGGNSSNPKPSSKEITSFEQFNTTTNIVRPIDYPKLVGTWVAIEDVYYYTEHGWLPTGWQNPVWAFTIDLRMYWDGYRNDLYYWEEQNRWNCQPDPDYFWVTKLTATTLVIYCINYDKIRRITFTRTA